MNSSRSSCTRQESSLLAHQELLVELAEELQSCVVTPDGSVLLDEAEAFNIATIPAPCIEIEYPDRLVTLTLSAERYTAEELAEHEEAAEVLARAPTNSGRTSSTAPGCGCSASVSSGCANRRRARTRSPTCS
jgi:hypothetical protein